MRALVTGAEGFVGRHLLVHLVDAGDEVWATVHRPAGLDALPPPVRDRARVADVRDVEAVRRALAAARPEVIYHLAAIAFVPQASSAPAETFAVNALGAVHVVDAARVLRSPPRLVLVSTAEVYGAVPEDRLPITEAEPLDPRTPYAASKAAMEMGARGMGGLPDAPEIVVLRPFNHTGPGQSSRFVCSDFARQVAAIEAGRAEPVLRVGNLSARRDFLDVRDVVRAYRMAATEGEAGAVYNVASGRARSIQWVLDTLVDMAAVEIRVEIDPTRFRPVDLPVLAGSADRLRRRTGWSPRIPFTRTLADLLDHWRRRT